MGVELPDTSSRSLYCVVENGAHANGIVKKSLKTKILGRRKDLGLGSINVDFTHKASYPMTGEEQAKDRRRKRSNRDSAHRCRTKQKEEYVQSEHLLKELNEEYNKLSKKVSTLESVKNNMVNKLKKTLPESKIHNALGRIDYADIIQSKRNSNDREEIGERESSPDREKIDERENSGESNDIMEHMNTSEVADVITVSHGLIINTSTLTTEPISYQTNDYPLINLDIVHPIDHNIENFEIGTAMSFLDQTVLSMVDTGVEVDAPIEQDGVNIPLDLLSGNLVISDGQIFFISEHTNSACLSSDVGTYF